MFRDMEEEIYADIKRELNNLVQNESDAEQLKVLLNFNRKSIPELGWELEDARDELISRVGKSTILRKIKNAPHIFKKITYNRYTMSYTDYVSEYLEEWFSRNKLSTEAAIIEKLKVVDKLSQEYRSFIRGVRDRDVEEWIDNMGNVRDLIEYSKEVMGELYMDALLVFIQQYSMADVDIYTINGHKISKLTQTGFSLAYYGDPGTGKTFATDDLLRGNFRKGIPPHGIIGRIRYGEGMTPKQFIAILEAYQDYPVDWIIPEFRDFFRSPGMVEKLKLVMERREITDETRKTRIGPYKVTSFFIVNYNLKLTRNGYRDTMSDPNFSAVEDRMICKLFLNTEERNELILKNMLRIARGEVDFYLANTLRKHITYTYYYLTKNHVKVTMKYSDYEKLATWIVNQKNRYDANLSMRIINRAVQIAASSALVSVLKNQAKVITIQERDIEIAKEFIKQELYSRALRSS